MVNSHQIHKHASDKPNEMLDLIEIQIRRIFYSTTFENIYNP